MEKLENKILDKLEYKIRLIDLLVLPLYYLIVPKCDLQNEDVQPVLLLEIYQE